MATCIQHIEGFPSRFSKLMWADPKDRGRRGNTTLREGEKRVDTLLGPRNGCPQTPGPVGIQKSNEGETPSH